MANIWVAPIEKISAAGPLTCLKGRPPTWYDWSADGRFVLYMRDENGDENAHLFAVDAVGGEPRDLTPLPGVTVRTFQYEIDRPGKIIVGLNDRDPRFHDAWLLDIATGARTLLFENAEGFGDLFFDFAGRLRLAERSDPATGGHNIYRMEGAARTPWRIVPTEDCFFSGGFFNRAGTHFTMTTSVGHAARVIVRIDMADASETVVARHPQADAMAEIVDPRTWETVAVAFDPLVQEWHGVDAVTRGALAAVKRALPGHTFNVVSQSADNRTWVVQARQNEYTFCMWRRRTQRRWCRLRRSPVSHTFQVTSRELATWKRRTRT